MVEPIRPKKINLTGKIIYIEDLLSKVKNEKGGKRFYLVFKDKNGKQIEAFPITSRIEYKDNAFRYYYVRTDPRLRLSSIVLTDKEFKTFIEKSIALLGLEAAKNYEYNYKKIDYEVINHKEIFRQIKEYSEK